MNGEGLAWGDSEITDYGWVRNLPKSPVVADIRSEKSKALLPLGKRL